MTRLSLRNKVNIRNGLIVAAFVLGSVGALMVPQGGKEDLSKSNALGAHYQSNAVVSPEIGIAETSPRGAVGGYAVPASGSSYTCSPTFFGQHIQGSPITISWVGDFDKDIKRDTGKTFESGTAITLGTHANGWSDASAASLPLGWYTYQLESSSPAADGDGTFDTFTCTAVIEIVTGTNPRPDLTASNLGRVGSNQSTSLAIDELITPRATLSNIGSVAVSGNFIDTFYYSYNGGAFISVRNFPHTFFSSTGVITESVGYSLSFGSPANITFRYCVDSSNAVLETNESNNCVERLYIVGGGSTQCNDTFDNDSDALIDTADPGCHTDGNASNAASYDPADTSETNAATQCSDGIDNTDPEDTLIDASDPGCHTDFNAGNISSYNPADTDETNGVSTQCSDGIDNADPEDTLIDLADPGCADASDNDETNAALTQCSDGIDNADPEDTLIDLADPGCANAADNDESNTVPTGSLKACLLGGASCTTGTLTINSGDEVQIMWTSTNAPNGCSGGTNFSAGGLPAGTDNTIVEPTSGTFKDFTLTCYQGALASTPVTVRVQKNTQCSDGIDNADPEDTLIDLADPGCANAADNDETNGAGGGGPTLQCNPSRVSQGGTCVLTPDAKGNSGCYITGTDVDPGNLDSDGNPNRLTSFTDGAPYTTGPILGQTTFTLSCPAPYVGADVSTTVRMRQSLIEE